MGKWKLMLKNKNRKNRAYADVKDSGRGIKYYHTKEQAEKVSKRYKKLYPDFTTTVKKATPKKRRQRGIFDIEI